MELKGMGQDKPEKDAILEVIPDQDLNFELAVNSTNTRAHGRDKQWRRGVQELLGECGEGDALLDFTPVIGGCDGRR